MTAEEKETCAPWKRAGRAICGETNPQGVEEPEGKLRRLEEWHEPRMGGSVPDHDGSGGAAPV